MPLVCLLFVSHAVAGAQDDEFLLWTHGGPASDGGCCDLWLSEVQQDPRHDMESSSRLPMPALLAEGRLSYKGLTQGVATWSFTENSSRVDGFGIDASRNVEAVLFVGRSSPSRDTEPVFGDVVGNVSWQLSQADGVVARGQRQAFRYDFNYTELRWSVPALADAVGPGPMLWNITVETDAPVAIAMNEQDGWSRIEVPRVPPVQPRAGPDYVDLSSRVAAVQYVTTEWTNGQRIYNWTNAEPHAVWHHRVFERLGSVTVVVKDGAGQEVHRHRSTGQGSAELTGVPGAWQVELAMKGFRGSVEFDLVPVPAPPAQRPPADPTPSSTPPPQAAQAPPPPDPAPPATTTTTVTAAGQESPGVGLGLAIALGALALAVRRRQ